MDCPISCYSDKYWPATPEAAKHLIAFFKAMGWEFDPEEESDGFSCMADYIASAMELLPGKPVGTWKFTPEPFARDFRMIARIIDNFDPNER